MDLFSVLSARFAGVPFGRDFSLARHTTIGCGGVAAVVAEPPDGESLASLLAYLKRERIPCFLMGAGANLLPSDGRFEGVVVRFSRMNALRSEGTAVFAGAGVTGGALCRFAAERGLSGCEPFTGIPMTVGGGTAMNAGIAEGHFSDVVEEVVAAEGGRLFSLDRADCAFSEKRSLFSEGVAVVGVKLRLHGAPREEIGLRAAGYRARRSTLPKGRSMGCAFVNPPKESAGRLIERCGLKGTRFGGAVVSARHANFLINEGGSAEDVSRLADLVKETVFARTGILLREEFRRMREILL